MFKRVTHGGTAVNDFILPIAILFAVVYSPIIRFLHQQSTKEEKMENIKQDQEVDQIITKLRELLRPMNMRMVAKASGINYHNLLNFSCGRTRVPTFDTVVKLQSYFRKRGEM
jgi:DNA-binding phage protein